MKKCERGEQIKEERMKEGEKKKCSSGLVLDAIRVLCCLRLESGAVDALRVETADRRRYACRIHYLRLQIEIRPVRVFNYSGRT